MEGLDDTEALARTDVPRWESWLADHHEQPSGICLLIAKKGSDEVSVSIGEASMLLCAMAGSTANERVTIRTTTGSAIRPEGRGARGPSATWSESRP